MNTSNNVLKRRLGEHVCVVTWGGEAGEGGGGVQGGEVAKNEEEQKEEDFSPETLFVFCF